MIVLDILTSLFTNFQLYSYSITFYCIEFLANMLLFIDNFLRLILEYTEIIIYFNLSSSSTALILMAVKFLICICLLIFARGGIPRFRFDYLTKLGLIRFLSLVLLFFLIEIFLLSLI